MKVVGSSPWIDRINLGGKAKGNPCPSLITIAVVPLNKAHNPPTADQTVVVLSSSQM